MIEINPYRRIARTFAFICYVIAAAVFGGGIFFSIVALTQTMDHVREEGITNARFALIVATMFATWTLMIFLFGWRVQRVFGQHRRTEKPVPRAAVGCLRLSSLGCLLWMAPGLMFIIFTGRSMFIGRVGSAAEWLVVAGNVAVVIILMFVVSRFITANFLALNDQERLRAYQAYLNAVQVESPRIADPEIRAFLQKQTSYVLPKLDHILKGTLLKDLSRLNLLTGSTRIVLHKADFRRADLCSSDLPEADLQEINLEEAQLEGALLSRINLSKARLKKSNLSRARLQEANLQQADLTEAVLSDAKLRAADLHGTTLEKANLSQANLQGANLKDANLRYANLEGAVLKETDLRGADLTGTILTAEQRQQARL
ncbi:MAG TPA: pentapeptide repeat-containing protein [Pyrinomonadaceae bacterium]|nr:pentapeptide repeat-containing protein [Pyrinomonadaceae bacterium]